jgi:hypothetical protein
MGFYWEGPSVRMRGMFCVMVDIFMALLGVLRRALRLWQRLIRRPVPVRVPVRSFSLFSLHVTDLRSSAGAWRLRGRR